MEPWNLSLLLASFRWGVDKASKRVLTVLSLPLPRTQDSHNLPLPQAYTGTSCVLIFGIG